MISLAVPAASWVFDLPGDYAPFNSYQLRDTSVWADAAYQSKRVDSFLKEAGYESRIQEKGSRHHPLDTAAKERNRERSRIRSKVEHVFGQMEMVMGGKLTRCIGLARVEGWWCLRNLVFNFLRFTQHKYGLVQA